VTVAVVGGTIRRKVSGFRYRFTANNSRGCLWELSFEIAGVTFVAFEIRRGASVAYHFGSQITCHGRFSHCHLEVECTRAESLLARLKLPLDSDLRYADHRRSLPTPSGVGKQVRRVTHTKGLYNT